ncbi:MAG: hypothetical protein EZS28_005253 [Streblomastix strix]|uniref:Uncharacterized protein n=1 Tax=Streblomastix strix TaxID=222440 RepID=A0A5J4WW24_9EUKA|nr:MAG: hypothetical protein EZS28_005253 [Streblomastix strix]
MKSHFIYFQCREAEILSPCGGQVISYANFSTLRHIHIYMTEKCRFNSYTLGYIHLDKSLQRGRKQNASTTVEVRVCLVKASTSVTEAPDDLNFVMHACLMDGPLYDYWIPVFRRIEVSDRLQQYDDAYIHFWKFQNTASPEVLIVDLTSIQFYKAEIGHIQ